MILSKIKQYAFSGIALLVTILSLGLARSQVKAAKKRAKEAEAVAHHQKVVAQKDKEILREVKRRRSEAKKELDAGRDPRVFRDPNSLFDDKDS